VNKITRLSKLTQVRWALQANSNIVIVGQKERNHLPNRDGYWSHTVDIIVAPKDGLYTAEELQSLMLSLVPENVEVTCKDDFQDRERELQFGKLYFDEVIGSETIHREIVIDDDVISLDNAVDGKLVIDDTKEVKRRTWVSVYPNAQMAAAALEGGGLYRVSKEELAKHRGIFDRLKKLIS